MQDIAILSKEKIKIGDQTVNVKPIGRGAFKSVFRVYDDNQVLTDRVLILSNGGLTGKNDDTLEAFTMCDESIFLPKMEKLGYTENFGMLFETKFYRKFLKVNVKKDHWKIYRIFKKACDKHCQEFSLNVYNGYEFCCAVIKEISNNKFINQLFIDALEDLISNIINYDSTFFFEISPRNLGVDEHGNMILIDPLYNKKIMLEYNIRKERKKRARI